MKFLMTGDIFGSPGRTVFASAVKRMKQSGECDFVIANAENAAGGKGLIPRLADDLFNAGADVLTLGDHAWDQRGSHAMFEDPRILRPANYPEQCPGSGFTTIETKSGNLLVINLLGRTFMNPSDSPFTVVDRILEAHADSAFAIIVDFHAEATSEKMAMGRYLDGRVTAVVGTHTHVQTSDERILPHGTAFMTDLGMTGPVDSIIGCKSEEIVKHFVTGMKYKFQVAKDSKVANLEGLIIEIDDKTGQVLHLERIRCSE